MSLVAYVPCRGGSKRIPGKNTKLLGGKPLLCWTLDAAFQSGVFDRVVLCPDTTVCLPPLPYAGLEVVMRPQSADDEPDIVWVRYVMDRLPRADAFAILRLTSPFRTAETIRRAWDKFQQTPCSSLRAVEPVKQHPGKMWKVRDRLVPMEPLIGETWPQVLGEHVPRTRTPWHSQPTQSLPNVYVQNSSLEIAWTWCVTAFDSISGPKVAPFFTEGWEGFSIDYPEDMDRAEAHVADLQAAGVK